MSIAAEPDPHSGSPVGVKVDATPARRPGPMVLEGRFGRVEKLDAARHGAAEAVLGWRWTFAFLAVGPPPYRRSSWPQLAHQASLSSQTADDSSISDISGFGSAFASAR